MQVMLLASVGAVVGAVIGFLFQAQQHLRPSQSKLKWVPALVVGRRFRQLAILLGWLVLGAALGGLFGAIAYAGLDAAAR